MTGAQSRGRPQRIAVFGGGAWGTALAVAARRAGRDVVLWAREAATVDAINRLHANPAYLPDIPLDPAIRATEDLSEAASFAEAGLLVVPAQYLRDFCAGLSPLLPPGVPVACAAKGIELGTGATMAEILADALPGHDAAILSGPTFAAEVARGLPAAVTVATRDAAVGRALVEAMGSATFRPYSSDDPVGAAIGGAVKNVLAIACGIVAGRGLGENARAGLITRGLAEIVRLALALGGRADTLMGLSGLGDLVLTCTTTQSRNYALGAGLGQGRSLGSLLSGRASVVEGVATATAARALADRIGVDMPIVAGVDAIVRGHASIDRVIEGLLARPFRDEAPVRP